MRRVVVAPGSVTVCTDVMCGWSTVALYRFSRAPWRGSMGRSTQCDLQLFPLEDVHQMALSTRIIEPEKPVVGALVPELEFKPWQRPFRVACCRSARERSGACRQGTVRFGRRTARYGCGFQAYEMPQGVDRVHDQVSSRDEDRRLLRSAFVSVLVWLARLHRRRTVRRVPICSHEAASPVPEFRRSVDQAFPATEVIYLERAQTYRFSSRPAAARRCAPCRLVVVFDREQDLSAAVKGDDAQAETPESLEKGSLPWPGP
jgi:hypothetical protein